MLDLLVQEEQAGAGIVFRCPTCSKVFVNDSELEPLCTGPHASLDEHVPTLMQKCGVRLNRGTIDLGLAPKPVLTVPGHLF